MLWVPIRIIRDFGSGIDSPEAAQRPGQLITRGRLFQPGSTLQLNRDAAGERQAGVNREGRISPLELLRNRQGGAVLRLMSSTATSGVLCSSHWRASAHDGNGPATEKPASSRKASRDIPISAWSSTIMQQGPVIASGLLFKDRISPPDGTVDRHVSKGRWKATAICQELLAEEADPLIHSGETWL